MNERTNERTNELVNERGSDRFNQKQAFDFSDKHPANKTGQSSPDKLGTVFNEMTKITAQS